MAFMLDKKNMSNIIHYGIRLSTYHYMMFS